jgi:hypothetical protein
MTGQTCAKGHPYEGNRVTRKNGRYTRTYCRICQSAHSADAHRRVVEAAAHLGISAKTFRTRYGESLAATQRALAQPPAEPVPPPPPAPGHHPRLDPRPHEWVEGCTVLVLCSCGYRAVCLDPADARDAFTHHARP